MYYYFSTLFFISKSNFSFLLFCIKQTKIEIGENACRLLKKMHETVALQALEKFSSCDVSKMRSKEGYLIGILRKAVEK